MDLQGRKTRKVLGLCLGMSLAVMILAACSSSKKTTDVSAGTSPTRAATFKAGQGVTATKIKIGVTIDESGAGATNAPQYRAAIVARFDALNAAGGVAGRKVVLTFLDDRGDPAQQLSNIKRFWEVDKDLLIFDASGFIAPPFAYLNAHKVPLFIGGGSPQLFSSKYPSIFVVGGQQPAWNAQMAYAVVHDLNRHPKVVAVTYLPYEVPLLGWIKAYWHKLGATTVLEDPDMGPTADCSSLVLKYKAAHVDYWDIQGPGFLSCIPAQIKLGWSPDMGQGGPFTSSATLTGLIGKPVTTLPGGLIAGSPAVQLSGAPLRSTPGPLIDFYRATMTKYEPKFSSDAALSDVGQLPTWQMASFVADMLTGTVKNTNELNPSALTSYSQSVKNWNAAGLGDPIKSMSPTCKTGTDSTAWGVWQWDSATKHLVEKILAPQQGAPHLINNDWLGGGECYLTQLADKYYK